VRTGVLIVARNGGRNLMSKPELCGHYASLRLT